VQAPLSLGIQQPQLKADHSPPSTSEVTKVDLYLHENSTDIEGSSAFLQVSNQEGAVLTLKADNEGMWGTLITNQFVILYKTVPSLTQNTFFFHTYSQWLINTLI
jgi:hypothetical protein